MLLAYPVTVLYTPWYSNNSGNRPNFSTRRNRRHIGSVLEMTNDRSFRFWAVLDTALATGKPQNEVSPWFEADVRGKFCTVSLCGLSSSCWAMREHFSGVTSRLSPRSSTSPSTRPCATSAAPRVSWRPRWRAGTRTRPARLRHPDRRADARKHIESDGMSGRVRGRLRRLLQGTASKGGRDHDGDDPARLEPEEKLGLVRAAYVRCLRTEPSSQSNA